MYEWHLSALRKVASRPSSVVHKIGEPWWSDDILDVFALKHEVCKRGILIAKTAKQNKTKQKNKNKNKQKTKQKNTKTNKKTKKN